MTKDEAEKRISVLKKEIDGNRYAYHVLDEPRVSDAVDDSLKRELSDLETQYPEFITSDSPTQRVGGEPLDKFVKVHHSSPMLSLNDAFSEEDLAKWQERLAKLVGIEKIKQSGYFCELKMDGLAVSLTYKNGVFKLGATRGDGVVGEDVTNNLKTIESIPLSLRHSEAKTKNPVANNGILHSVQDDVFKKELEIRGEAYLPRADFEKLNQEQKKKGQPLYANPRNIAAGSIRQLDPKITAGRNLDFMMYAIPTDSGLKKHSEEHDLARDLGFRTNQNNKICSSLDDVFAYIKHWNKEREKLPYQTDGIVVGINDEKLFKQLGVVGKAPRGQIAYKFPAEEATSVVKDIIVQVGRTGKLTPVAVMEPTLVAGSVVSRATLHNADEVKRKDIKIGDTVIIRKAGDVIPEVVEVIKRMRNGDEKTFKMPETCPICGGKVVKREGEVDYFCADKNCSIRQLRSISHFVAKGAFEIDGLGPKIIEQLVNEGLVKDAADLFDLKEGDLEPLERFAEQSSKNLVEAIINAKSIELDSFIYALGIRHVGTQMATDLAKQFGSLENLMKADEGDFERMYGIGGKVAESLIEYLKDEKNIKFIKKLQSFGVKIKNYHSPVSANKLDNKTFVVTGTLETMTRDEAHKRIVQYGGQISSSVSPKTDYVLAGENPGSKYDKARTLGVKILTEQEFLGLLK